MARTFPSTGVAPIDAYTEEKTRPMMYLEKTAFSGTVFNNQVATIRVNVPASATISGFACALVVRMEIGASATVSAMRGIYMYHDSDSAMPDTDASFIRFEDNSGTATYGMNCILEYAGKSSTTVGTEYFIQTNSAQAPWFRKTGALTLTQSGWLKCYISDADRYIALYSA